MRDLTRLRCFVRLDIKVAPRGAELRLLLEATGAMVLRPLIREGKEEIEVLGAPSSSLITTLGSSLSKVGNSRKVLIVN